MTFRSLPLWPGNSVGTISSGNRSLASGAAYSADLDPANSQGNGTADLLNVTGSVSLGGSNLAINLLSAPTPGQTFTVVLNDGTDPIPDTFAQGSSATAAFGGTAYTFNISYNVDGGDGTPNDVVLTAAVPEPASAALFGLAAAGLLARRRRRRCR